MVVSWLLDPDYQEQAVHIWLEKFGIPDVTIVDYLPETAASFRNCGHILYGTVESFDALCALHGQKAAEELFNFSVEVCHDVKNTIAQLASSADEIEYEQSGYHVISIDQNEQLEIERSAAKLNKLGIKNQILDKNQIESLGFKHCYGARFEQGDAKAEVEALTSISQLGYEQGKLAEIKSKQAMEEKEAKARPTLPTQPVQQTPPPDPKAEAWAEKNEWFGKDNAMTYTAFDLHRKITEEEGIDPKSDEYYEEIDKRIRLEFPHKFGKTKAEPISKPTQNVASATRSSKAGRKSVRLTSSQVAIAKKLGVPLEEYAKQLITKEV